MNIDLAGRAAVVTGGSKGIGFAVATRFAASGADVAIVARGREALDQAVKSIGATARGRVVAVQGDVAVASDFRRAFDEAMAAFVKIDILVNNAGTSRTAAFEAVTDEMWREDFDQKLFAAIRLTRLAWPQMKERRWGRIINVLNIGAKAPRPGSAPTSVTRASLDVIEQEDVPGKARRITSWSTRSWSVSSKPTSMCRGPRGSGSI